MKNNKYRVMYSEFSKTKENDELLKKLSNDDVTHLVDTYKKTYVSF